MRKDQLQTLYGLTLLAFVIGAVLEWTIGNSLSAAVRTAALGLAASLLAATLIATYVQWSTLGVSRYYRQWLTERPNLRDAFRQAKTVEICAVTFWNTLFGQPWFTEAFRERIVASIDGKETRILLLQPDGREIARRQSEGRPIDEGKSVTERNQAAVTLLVGVLDEENVDEHGDFIRFFDYAPPGNWLRIDGKGYFVMLSYGRRGHQGGFSPALLVDESRLGANATLFDVYNRNFKGMWEQAKRGNSTRTAGGVGAPAG